MRYVVLFIPFLLFVVLAGVTIGATGVRRRRKAANLQKLATQLGLEFISVGNAWIGTSFVSGTLRGKQVKFFNYSTGAGKSGDTTWSAMTAQVATPGTLAFTLEKRGFVAKIERLFGAHEVTVGNAEFDRAWFMRSNRPVFLRAALIPELRAKLMAALHGGITGKFELKGGEVKYAEIGGFSDQKRTDRFAALADVVCDLVDVAEVAAREPGKA
jgi:hypothetical protein